MFKHEDDRRSLIEWGVGGNWKVAKVVIAKRDCVVGGHYHKNKDEMFLLLSGDGIVDLAHTAPPTRKLVAPDIVHVLRGEPHTFHLTEGSILLGLASEPFDPADDHK